MAVGRSRDIGDPPDLAGERDYVGGVLDDLDRGRPVQAADDGREGAVPVDPQERAGVRLRWAPSYGPSQTPWERAKSVRPRPNSTSTASLAPAATSVAVVAFGPNTTILPSSGLWGMGPAWAA